VLLKVHRPYHESDHVLNIAYNALCGGLCLEDIELRRQDEAFLDALGARRIPDPTTEGDFCRRFDELGIRALRQALHDTRHQVWAQNPRTSSHRPSSTWTVRWWAPPAPAKKAWTSPTMAPGAITRWW
jgi:hypothetical protein